MSMTLPSTFSKIEKKAIINLEQIRRDINELSEEAQSLLIQDQYHQSAQQTLAQYSSEPLITTWSVLTESCHLLF